METNKSYLLTTKLMFIGLNCNYIVELLFYQTFLVTEKHDRLLKRIYL